MKEELISKAALFFFLLTLDDKIATESTLKTLELYRIYSKNKSPVNLDELTFENTLLAQCCLNQWQKIRANFRKEQVQIITSKALRWPEHIDLNPWKEFQKRAPEAVLIAVAWVHVLGLTESILAKCLNVSEGTVSYRVGKGLSLLGQLNRPNISSLQFS